jgi:vitamin B12 transporter
MTRFILLLLLLAPLAPLAHADSTNLASPVIVTADRHAQTADETLASVSVITRKDIENSQARDLVDLLRMEAGIDIARNGGPGQPTSLFLRGTNSDQTLVLIDGVRASSATTGSFPFERLSLSDIDHIEIVRGPRAVLYGSDAVGGVIQIFTRHARHTTVRSEAGSFGTLGASAATVFGRKTRVHLSADYGQSVGFSATNANSGSYYFPDNDGYTRRSITAAVDSRVSDRSRLSLRSWNAANDVQYDQGTEHSINDVSNLRFSNATTDDWTQTLTLGTVTDQLETDDTTFGALTVSHVTTHRTSAQWVHDLSLGRKGYITAGLSYEQVHAVDDNAPFDKTIADSAIFALWHRQIGRNDLEIGGRADAHSAFGQHDSGQISWGHPFGRGHRVYVSYGTAFKAPNANELYSLGYGGFFAGNPKLQPETSASAEIGLKFRWRRTALDTSLYSTDVRNLIAFQGPSNQATNIGHASLQGIGISLTRALGAWSSVSNLSLQQARDAGTGQALLRRPDAKLSLQLRRRFSSGSDISLELLAAESHADISNITYNTIDVPGYAVINLAAHKPLGGGWTLQGRVQNLTDTHYEVVSGYNTTPLSLYVGLRYTRGGKDS